MHPRLGLGESQCLQALLDSVFGHVVPEEEDGLPLRVLGGDAILSQ